MGMRITADGTHALVADLRDAGTKIGPLVSQVVRKTALDVQADAQAFAPVDTGNLRSSIGHEVMEHGEFIIAEIGPTASYGIFVEHGTSRMAPRAFLGPAMDRRSPQFAKALEQLVDRVL